MVSDDVSAWDGAFPWSLTTSFGTHEWGVPNVSLQLAKLKLLPISVQEMSVLGIVEKDDQKRPGREKTGFFRMKICNFEWDFLTSKPIQRRIIQA